MLGFGWQELLIVLVIVMIIFGAGKLTQVGNALGRGVKEFKTEAVGGGTRRRHHRRNRRQGRGQRVRLPRGPSRDDLERLAEKLVLVRGCGDEAVLGRPPRAAAGSHRRRPAPGRGGPPLRRRAQHHQAVATSGASETGGVVASPRPGRSRRIGREAEAALVAQVRAAPDATLAEHCATWAASTGVGVSPATMSRALGRAGWPLKKSRSSPPNVTRPRVPPGARKPPRSTPPTSSSSTRPAPTRR